MAKTNGRILISKAEFAVGNNRGSAKEMWADIVDGIVYLYKDKDDQIPHIIIGPSFILHI